MINMNIEKIVYHTFDEKTFNAEQRDMIVINGTGFSMGLYRSSGEYSNVGGTWFPFFGIKTQDDDETIYGKGWIIKNAKDYFKNDKAHYFTEALEARIRRLGGNSLSIRFSSLPAMLISSHLGGGVWETKEGIKLKEDLMKEYPDFYKTWPELNVSFEGKHIQPGDHESVNTWLFNKTKANDAFDLQKKFIKNVEDLKAPEPKDLEVVMANNILNTLTDKDHKKLTQAALDFLATQDPDPKNVSAMAHLWLLEQYSKEVAVNSFEELKTQFIDYIKDAKLLSKTEKYLKSLNDNDYNTLAQAHIDISATEGKKTSSKHANEQARRWVLGLQRSKEVKVNNFEDLKSNFMDFIQKGHNQRKAREEQKKAQVAISQVKIELDLNNAKAFTQEKEELSKEPGNATSSTENTENTSVNTSGNSSGKISGNTSENSSSNRSSSSDSDSDANVKTDKAKEVKISLAEIIDDYKKPGMEDNWVTLPKSNQDAEEDWVTLPSFKNHQDANLNKKSSKKQLPAIPPKNENNKNNTRGFLRGWW